ncbi:MAG: hypothetical protein ACI8TX_000064 [Hyphomicrobiaceae bacterium]|jgi:hypothetical protein
MLTTFSRALAAIAIASLVATPAAMAQISKPIKSYATDKCVSGKQQAVGKFCASVLKAESIFALKGDAEKRTTAIAKAELKLGTLYGKAEEKAAKKNADCTETGQDSATVIAATGTAVSDAATTLIGATCTDAAGILKSASKLCGGLFKAESKHMKKRTKDPLRTALVAARVKAEGKNADKIADLSCDAGALSAFDASLGTAAADALLGTITSEVVPTASWIEIAGDEVTYGKEVLSPLCAGGPPSEGAAWEATPWKMWARKGTVNNLLVYYQGGGACWNNITCGANQCDLTVGAGDDPNNFGDGEGLGLFDITDPENPFADWHMVFVPYCSCDVHWGNKRAIYPGLITPAPVVEHRGRINASFAEKYAREHFVNPDQIMVAGSSAGGLGAMFNSLWLHEAFPSSQMLTLGDAAAGVSSEAFRETDILNWGVLGTLPRHVEGLDLDIFTNTTTDEVVIAGADHYASRNSRFAEYNTYSDYVFSLFYNAMINPGDPANWRASSCSYTEELLTMEGNLTTGPRANIRTYLGSGSDHTMWFHPKVYTDAVPALGGGGSISLIDFINDMVTEPAGPNWVNARCDDSGTGCDHVCADFPNSGFTCDGNPDKHQDGSGTALAPCP